MTSVTSRSAGVLSAVLALAMVGTGCATRQGAGGRGGAEKVAKIGFIGPLTGPIAPLGVGMKNAAKLAVDQAIKAGTVKDWKLEFRAEDDAGDAKQGADVAQKLASDPAVAAVIGPLNSSVAQRVQPVLAPPKIALISPANTNPMLTMGLDWQTKPKRQYPTYFRVVATDREQGLFGAKYAFDTLKRKNAVAIHDKKTYGQGLATIFAINFEKFGGKVLSTIEINPGEGDYKAAVTRAKGKNPDLIYYGGEFPEAAIIAKNMSELGMKAPEVILMGGDGIVDQNFIENSRIEKTGNAPAEGHYATVVGASPELLPASKSFIDDYAAAGFKEPFSAFGTPSYDAANIVIQALAKVLPGKTKIDSGVREEVVRAIQATIWDGALGATSFNEFGDTTNRLLTINRVENGKFKGLEAAKL